MYICNKAMRATSMSVAVAVPAAVPVATVAVAVVSTTTAMAVAVAAVTAVAVPVVRIFVAVLVMGVAMAVPVAIYYTIVARACAQGRLRRQQPVQRRVLVDLHGQVLHEPRELGRDHGQDVLHSGRARRGVRRRHQHT